MLPSNESLPDHQPLSVQPIRPCRFMLRGLALWQPTNACPFMKYYNWFGYLVLTALVIGVLYLGTDTDGIHFKKSLNGAVFSAIFVVAFI